jgi:TM2 domain-containing membrane protein YozV
LNTIQSNSCIAQISPKARLVGLLLCWFLGGFGAHRFYVGKVGTALLMIFTLGGLGIWVLIDLILILVGSFRDKNGRVVFYWFERYSLNGCPESSNTSPTQ